MTYSGWFPVIATIAKANINGQVRYEFGAWSRSTRGASHAPLTEQRRIVAKVEQRMAWVDALETQLAASRATAARRITSELHSA